MSNRKEYRSSGDDNGRCEGGFTEFTTEHIISHFDYDKRY